MTQPQLKTVRIQGTAALRLLALLHHVAPALQESMKAEGMKTATCPNCNEIVRLLQDPSLRSVKL